MALGRRQEQVTAVTHEAPTLTQTPALPPRYTRLPFEDARSSAAQVGLRATNVGRGLAHGPWTCPTHGNARPGAVTATFALESS